MLEVQSILTGENFQTQLSQVAPGQYVATDIDATDVPRYGVIRLMRQPDGSYLPVMKLYGQHRRISGLAEEMGLPGFTKRTLERLVSTGFVSCRRPSPHVTLVDMGSLMDHLEACRDPEFWTPARLAQYGKGWKA